MEREQVEEEGKVSNDLRFPIGYLRRWSSLLVQQHCKHLEEELVIPRPSSSLEIEASQTEKRGRRLLAASI